MNGRRAKDQRREIRDWIRRGLHDYGIQQQTGYKMGKIKRERVRSTKNASIS